jgi:hypothetical protein
MVRRRRDVKRRHVKATYNKYTIKEETRCF